MKKFNSNLLPALVAVCLTVGAANAQPQLPVDLGSNSTFAILAGTTVTVTGGGTITGNIGVSPGDTFVPGTPPVTVNGTIYLGAGSAAAQAQVDLTAAFNDAAGRQTPVIVSGNIGGQTLAPGLYKSESSLAISSGELTLDAGGDASAVFIFQIGSTFTMTSGRQVILAGNANAANIFWQVGSSATLGTTSVLHGNILAGISISALTGSRLHGRALARSGAVSVDTGGGSSVSLPGSSAPLIPPTVISTVPANGASGVPLNSAIVATFSTTMDSATITTSSFTVMQGLTPVSGTVTYSGTNATFAPAAPLVPLATYTATITTGARDLAGTALASNHVWSFTASTILDTTPPTVTSTVPAANAVGVPINSKITATFSEAMDPATITTSSFTLMQGATPVAGAVSYIGTTATFTPAAPLTLNTSYTATISSGATDLAGNALASDYVWSFAAGAIADTTPPTVISTIPAANAAGVPINSKITATFSEAMDPSTIGASTFTLTLGGTPVAGAVTYIGTTATFTPASALATFAIYTATIRTGAEDLAGNALASNYVWSFTAGVSAETTPPTVISTVPAAGASGVDVNTLVSATFSEAMDPYTITTSSFNLRQGADSVVGTVTYNDKTAIFTPAAPLALNASYTATLTTGVTDLAGNTFHSPFTWSFSTGVAAGPSPTIDPEGTINNMSGTVNAASYERPVAAGSIAAVFGSNLAIGESDPEVATPLLNTLSESSFTIGGRVAPLYFASPGQVNLQIPWTLAGLTQAPIQATVDGETSNLQMVSLAPFAPGIFTMDLTGTGQGAILIAPTDQLAAPDHPVLRGEYISIYCTGLGAVTNEPATGAPALAIPLSFTLVTPTVTIGGAEAEVTYSGLAPGFAGLYQVNAIVPEGSSAGDAVPVALSIGGVTSNTVTIAVQ
jgi:uncharacterized protein (TIGR03437 family)